MRLGLTCLLLVWSIGAAWAAPPRPAQLVGCWHSRTNLGEGTLTFLDDGSFLYRDQRSARTLTGWWRLRGQTIAWEYSSPSPEQPDVNTFAELSADRFVLRERDGSLSVFTREQPLVVSGSRRCRGAACSCSWTQRLAPRRSPGWC